MSKFLEDLDAAFEAMQDGGPSYVVGAPLAPSVRRMMARWQVVDAETQGLFALASVFSGLPEQAGYFARRAFQHARSSVALLEGKA